VTAPLQRQIADQQKQIADQQNQIKTLQLKIESQTMAALKGEARNEALLDGIGAGLGTALAFLVAVAVFQRLARKSAAEKRTCAGCICVKSKASLPALVSAPRTPLNVPSRGLTATAQSGDAPRF
jgi:hypothetical protein